ncbi:MAG: hisA/hisF family protein [Planctomycetota bacterium]|nr:MAG: hisA/hisF family protein [Planctomycetota bacterium]
MYVADLDGILNQRPNVEVFQCLAADGFELLIDGGLRSLADARRLLDAGATKLIVGLETLADRSLLAALIGEFGAERIVFSLDLKAGQPLLGDARWPDPTPLGIAASVIELGVTQMIVLDLASVGEQRGPSTLELCRSIRALAPNIRLITGGGVRNVADLEPLRAARIVRDHVACSRFDRLLPMVGAELTPVRLACVSEVDRPRTVDECSQTIHVERGHHVRRAPSLSTVARHQQRDMRHRLPQLGQLVRVRRANHRTDAAVVIATDPRPAQRCQRQLFDNLSDLLIDRRAVGDSILQRAGSGIAGADEDIQAGTSFGRDLYERFERVTTEVRIDGQRIGGPGGGVGIGSGQIAASVRFGG